MKKNEESAVMTESIHFRIDDLQAEKMEKLRCEAEKALGRRFKSSTFARYVWEKGLKFVELDMQDNETN